MTKHTVRELRKLCAAAGSAKLLADLCARKAKNCDAQKKLPVGNKMQHLFSERKKLTILLVGDPTSYEFPTVFDAGRIYSLFQNRRGGGSLSRKHFWSVPRLTKMCPGA